MARKLVNICLAWTLVLGCWGGVIAAVACPHMGCETASASVGHGAHGERASDEGHAPADAEDHSAHGEAHQEPATEAPAPDRSASESVAPAAGASGGHDGTCSHCVGRPGAPPSSAFEWQADSARKLVKYAAPHAAPRVLAPSPTHAREITPAQHAPPGGADKLLLLSVFRI